MEEKKTIFVHISDNLIEIFLKKENLELIRSVKVDFKKNFNTLSGLSAENLDILINFLQRVRHDYSFCKIKIYATGIFSEMNFEMQTQLIFNVFEKLELKLNILPTDLQDHYYKKAFTHGKEEELIDMTVMVLKIRDYSTEIIIIKQLEEVEKIIAPIGKKDVLKSFPEIADEYSKLSLRKIASYISGKFPKIDRRVDFIFFSGNMLDLMKNTGFNLLPNNIFTDSDHEFFISNTDFQKRSSEIHEKVKLKDLGKLVAEERVQAVDFRICVAVALALFNVYNIEQIVPSNLSMIDGLASSEYRNVSIGGNFQSQNDYILTIKELMSEKGANILTPDFLEVEDGSLAMKRKARLDAIKASDVYIVCNPTGYSDPSIVLETGFAYALSKRVIYTDNPEEFSLRVFPHEVGI